MTRHELVSAIGLASIQLWVVDETGMALIDLFTHLW